MDSDNFLEFINHRFNWSKNVLYAMGEFVLNTLFVMVGYRLVVKQGGVGALGVWSTLFAWTNLIRIGDVGVSAAIVRFLPHWDISVEEDKRLARVYAETALITNIVLFAVLAMLGFLGFSPFVPRVVGQKYAIEAMWILPYMFLGFYFLNISGTILGILQGLHLGYQRSQLSVFGKLLHLVVAIVTIPRIGLMGLAVAQIVQYSIVSLVGWGIARSQIGSRLLPHRFDGRAFREMLSYSIKAQVVNVTNGLIEPVSKMLIGYFGGMEIQGLFELSFKTVLLPRNFIGSAISASLPTISALFEKDRIRLRQLYSRIFFVSVSGMGIALLLLVFVSPILSRFWLGRVDYTYCIYVGLIGVAFWINLAGAPSFVLGMATGRMRFNIISALVALGVLIILGVTLGFSVGPNGAVLASSLAIGSAGALIWYYNQQLL